MNKAALGVVVLIAAAAFIRYVTSSPNADTGRIYVRVHSDGEAHLEFSGNIMSMKGGQVTSKSISGSTPDAFYITADSVSIAVQKKSAGNGVLAIAVERNNKILNEFSTTADFGMVTLTAK